MQREKRIAPRSWYSYKWSRTILWAWNFAFCLAYLLHWCSTCDCIYEPLRFGAKCFNGTNWSPRTTSRHDMTSWMQRPFHSEFFDQQGGRQSLNFTKLVDLHDSARTWTICFEVIKFLGVHSISRRQIYDGKHGIIGYFAWDKVTPISLLWRAGDTVPAEKSLPKGVESRGAAKKRDLSPAGGCFSNESAGKFPISLLKSLKSHQCFLPVFFYLDQPLTRYNFYW